MEERLSCVGLTLENVVQMNCLFKNIRDIPVMEKTIRRRFHSKYPVRKSFQTEFADPGHLLFQVGGIAYSAIKPQITYAPAPFVRFLPHSIIKKRIYRKQPAAPL